MRAADRILSALLDRHERRPPGGGVRRISEDAPDIGDADVHEAFMERLGLAASRGAVTLVMGKGETSHILRKVTLADPAPLYSLLGRQPRSERHAAASLALASLPLSSDEARAGRDRMADAWSRGRPAYGLKPEDLPQATAVLKVVDAVMGRDPGDTSDMRSFSNRTLGDSKAVERHWGKLCAVLRDVGRVPPETDDAGVGDILGLSKFQHPVLIAGPLTLDGRPFGDMVYLGVAPDHVAQVGLDQEVDVVLTVENLASFNRHVREARRPGEVVVYLGGWPSLAVMALLERLAVLSNARFMHWGDLDPEGAAIGNLLHERLPGRVSPHLMDPALAAANGRPPERRARRLPLPAESPFADLAAYLEREDALFMEQERLDPVPTAA